MSNRKLISSIFFFCTFFICTICLGQEEKEEKSERFYNERFDSKIRGKNAITIGGGSSIMNGDYVNPMFEIYFHAGYKRFLGSHVNINFTYHKFNLAYEDLFNNGFMSFDLNLELNILPFDSFSPFVYVGGGLNAANYFESKDSKVQGGGGVEYLISDTIGVKFFGEYNYLFTDMIDGREFGATDDVYWRMGMGLNFYFGRHAKRNRISGEVPTVIESNPIVDDYK